MSHLNSHYEIKTIWGDPLDGDEPKIEFKMVEDGVDPPCADDAFRVRISTDKNDMLIDIGSALGLDEEQHDIRALTTNLLHYDTIRKTMHLGDRITDPEAFIYDRDCLLGIEGIEDDDGLNACALLCDTIEHVHGLAAGDAQWMALRPRSEA